MVKLLLITLSFLFTIFSSYLSMLSCAVSVPTRNKVLSLQEQSAKVAARNLISEADSQEILRNPDYFYALQKLPQDVQKLLSKNMHIFLDKIQQAWPIANVLYITSSSDGQVIVTRHLDDDLTVWHRTKAGFVKDPEIQQIHASYITLSADGQIMVIESLHNDAATVWHRTKFAFVQYQQEQQIRNVRDIKLSSDGQIMVVKHLCCAATVWHKTESGFVSVQQIQNVRDIKLSLDGQVMVVKHPNLIATVWYRTEAGFVLVQQIRNVDHVTLSADGQVMLVRYENYPLCLLAVWYRTEAGFVSVEQMQPICNVNYIILSADGQVMLARHLDKNLTVWHRTEAGFVLVQQICNVDHVTLSADGQVMTVRHKDCHLYPLTVWYSTRVAVWHRAKVGFTFVQQIQDVDYEILSADGRLLFTFDKNHKVSIFESVPLTQLMVVCALSMLKKRNENLDFEKHWHLLAAIEFFSFRTKESLKEQFNVEALTEFQKVQIEQKRKECGLEIEELAKQGKQEQSQTNNDFEASSSNDVE